MLFQLFHEIERERCPGPVDVEVAHQPQRALCPYQGRAAKKPIASLGSPGFDNTFGNHFVDEIDLNAAGATEFSERQCHLGIEDDAA